MTRTLTTDYLVVGAGATGLALVDALHDASDADVILIDRRHSPGGHWLDAYPFARLHNPSGVYGVSSTPLGGDGWDPDDADAGILERASAAEVCAYYDRVLRQRLLPSGRVRFFGSCHYLGGGRFRSMLSGLEFTVTVRRRTVDATYMRSDVPATTPPPFLVEEGTRCIPVGELTRVVEPPDGFVIVGAGKTAQDACLWLLAGGVPPEAIRWIRPRDPWLVPRRYVQPGSGAATSFDGHSRSIEVAATAESESDLFSRLERDGLLLRIDAEVTPTTYKGATVSDRELAALRSIANVIRLGRVRQIGPHEILLDGGSVHTTPGTLHVHCAAAGVRIAQPRPVFGPGVITPQMIRFGHVCFSAALVGHLEAGCSADTDKNILAAPIQMTDTAGDWMRVTAQGLRAEYLWTHDPDVAMWLGQTRLNITRGLSSHRDRLLVRQASQRYASHARAAADNLRRLLESAGRPRTPANG
jgi:hypothetical protein